MDNNIFHDYFKIIYDYSNPLDNQNFQKYKHKIEANNNDIIYGQTDKNQYQYLNKKNRK